MMGLKLWGLWLLTAVVAAAAQENELRWAPFNVVGEVSSSAAMSPDEKTIYVGVTTRPKFGRLVAISLADPTRAKWVFPQVVGEVGAFYSSPAVAPDGTVYIGCDDGKLYALKGETGEKLWEYNTGSESLGKFIWSSPAIAADGTLYFGAGDGMLHAVSPSGRRVWAFNGPKGFIDSSPAIGPDGTVYVGSRDWKLYAVAPNGEEKWNFATGAPITSSPAIGPDGTIYIGSFDEKLYAIAPDGSQKWAHSVLAPIFSSPAIGADGTIYLGASPNFFALNPELIPEKGREKWVTYIGSSTKSTAAVRGDGVIVFGADDHKVHFLNPDGTQRPSFDNGGTVDDNFEASPLIGRDGTIYIGSTASGRFYALNGNGSPLSNYSSWPAYRRDTTHTGRALAEGTGQLINISARAQVGGGSAAALIAGITITGASNSGRAYLIRGIGPTLASFGVNNPMADPQLQMFDDQRPLPTLRNDNWADDLVLAAGSGLSETFVAVGAFGLPVGSRDAALVAGLSPGRYHAHVTSVNGQAGVALVEAYDVMGTGDPTSRIVNLSTRAQVGTGGNVLIPGVVVGGTGTVRLLIRGVGPGLTQFKVSGVLARPVLSVFSKEGKMLGSNQGWTRDGYRNDLMAAAKHVGAFALDDNSADSALILNVTPGGSPIEYTIQVSGDGGTTGEGLVEIYLLP